MIVIRTATLSELPVIQQIARQTWPHTFGEILTPAQITYMLDWMYSLPSLTEQVTQRGHVFLLAQDGSDFPGFASYETNYQNEPKTKLHKIYILPNQQGRGVGRLLMDEVIRLARQQGNTSLSLNVNRHNRAKEFYERLGFHVAAEEDIDIGGGYLMQDYVMERGI